MLLESAANLRTHLETYGGFRINTAQAEHIGAAYARAVSGLGLLKPVS
jgi:hypothetical protein